MINKKGDGGWNVKKLLTLVLVVVLVALLAVGITTGALTPVKDYFEAKINSAILTISKMFGGGGSGADCQERFLRSVVSSDSTLIQDIGGTEDTKVEVCRKYCMLKMPGRGSYLLEDGKFKRYHYREDGGYWNLYGAYIRDDLEESKFLQEFYNDVYRGIDTSGSKDEVLDFYNKRKTGIIILEGIEEGGSYDESVSAIWKDGNWVIFKGIGEGINRVYGSSIKDLVERNGERVLYNGPSYDGMIEIFKKEIWEGESPSILADTDRVYYSIIPWDYSLDALMRDGQQKPINDGVIDGDDQIDDKPELSVLKEFIDKKTKEFLEAKKYSSEELDKLKSSVNKGFAMDVGNNYYNFGDEIEISDGLPIIIVMPTNRQGEPLDTNIPGNTKYGLRFSPEKNDVLAGANFDPVEFNHLPLEIVRFENGGWVGVGDPREYKLNDRDWEEFKRARLIKDFLTGVCMG